MFELLQVYFGFLCRRSAIWDEYPGCTCCKGSSKRPRRLSLPRCPRPGREGSGVPDALLRLRLARRELDGLPVQMEKPGRKTGTVYIFRCRSEPDARPAHSKNVYCPHFSVVGITDRPSRHPSALYLRVFSRKKSQARGLKEGAGCIGLPASDLHLVRRSGLSSAAWAPCFKGRRWREGTT